MMSFIRGLSVVVCSCLLLMAANPPEESEKIPDRWARPVPLDDPAKFNWTRPNLFRWKIYSGKIEEPEHSYINEKNFLGIANWKDLDKNGKQEEGEWVSAFEPSYIDDANVVVYRGEGWICKASKTFRATSKGKISPRIFSEWRNLVCAHGYFKARIDVSCSVTKKGKKQVSLNSDFAWLKIGDGMSLSAIGLYCETWRDDNNNGKNDEGEWLDGKKEILPKSVGEALDLRRLEKIE